MYVGRNLSELNDILLRDWDIKELAYYHHTMSDLADLLNAQGVSLHQKIITEVNGRGGLSHHNAAWDHASEIIYD